MRTTITYSTGFTIPKLLPHAAEENGYDLDVSDIFSDDVYIGIDGKLVLSSLHGETRFHPFTEESDCYVIEAGTTAQYDGAYRALNTVWGVEFPESTLGEITSSYGAFKTVDGYDLARRAISFTKQMDAQGTAKGALVATLTEVAVISLEDAVRVLDECLALRVDGCIFQPSLSPLNESDDNEFAYFEWEDSEGLGYSAKFAEGENQRVAVANNQMILVDTEGDEVEISLLGPLLAVEFLSKLRQEVAK